MGGLFPSDDRFPVVPRHYPGVSDRCSIVPGRFPFGMTSEPNGTTHRITGHSSARIRRRADDLGFMDDPVDPARRPLRTKRSHDGKFLG